MRDLDNTVQEMYTVIEGGGIVLINLDVGYALALYAFMRGKLVFGSSANFSNAGNHYRFNDVEERIRRAADFAVDLGESKHQGSREDGKGLAATIIDLENDVLLRRGLVCREVIQQARSMGLAVSNY